MMAINTAVNLTPKVSDRDHSQGPEDATVVFVEYGDYECPHCKQVQSIVHDIQDEVGDRIIYVFRHFPIRSVHRDAQLAAEAAEAAAAQGKFWEMHQLLFDHQGELDEVHLIQYAAELGLDLERFKSDLLEHVYADRVQKDFLSGVRSGVNGTPTFYINGARYDGAWDQESLLEEIEKPLGVQVRQIFQRFTQLQASGGVLLLIATILALVWANSPIGDSYFDFWGTYLSISIGDFSLSENLVHWVNDGLMVLFFLVVGLEIKRELTVGELASPRRAALPIMGAIGGMLFPAAFYLVFNYGTEGESGWGIPMATDIAFTLGVLTVLGSRIPLGLKVFFTALAIVDDLGAVLVIAIFYSSEILWVNLIFAGIILLMLIVLNRMGVRRPLPYWVLGFFLWLAFFESGVHPTIAGVLLAFTIPARSGIRMAAYQDQCLSAFDEMDATADRDEVGMADRQQAAAHTLETIAERMQSPAQRLEHSLTPWATYLVIPIFALANAGVRLRGDFSALTNPIAVGIFVGLVIGKPLGVSLMAWLAVKLRLAELPHRVTWSHMYSASWLAGIGFTMSLFIASSAFSDPGLLSIAKISILLASLVAAVIGTAGMVLTTAERDKVTELESSPAT
jgi:NhaA family Na+:H+ antiporter